MNKKMRTTVQEAKKMSLHDAQVILHVHSQQHGVDRLRWLKYGTQRYDMNRAVLEAAREIVGRGNPA